MPDHVGGHHSVLAESEYRVYVILADMGMTIVGIDCSNNTEKAQLQ